MGEYIKEALEAIENINYNMIEGLYYHKSYDEYTKLSSIGFCLSLVNSKRDGFYIEYLGYPIFSSEDDERPFEDDSFEPRLSIEEYLKQQIIKFNTIMNNRFNFININLSSKCTNVREV